MPPQAQASQFCAVSIWQPGLARFGSLRHNLQEPEAASSDLVLHGVCLLTHTVFPRASAGSRGAPYSLLISKACLPAAVTPEGFSARPQVPAWDPPFASVFFLTLVAHPSWSPVQDFLSASLGRNGDSQVHFLFFLSRLGLGMCNHSGHNHLAQVTPTIKLCIFLLSVFIYLYFCGTWN